MTRGMDLLPTNVSRVVEFYYSRQISRWILALNQSHLCNTCTTQAFSGVRSFTTTFFLIILSSVLYLVCGSLVS
jgi:hypothetical protein